MKDIVTAEEEVHSKLEMQCKKCAYFYLIMLGIPSILILSVEKKWMGEGVA